MSSFNYSEATQAEPHLRRTILQTVRSLWCRHRRTVTTPKTPDMPAHAVCLSCGWREPLLPAAPQGTRTWDLSRDEKRYRLEKRRRERIEQQRLAAEAQLTLPAPVRPVRRTAPGRATVVPIKPIRPAVGE